MMFSTRFRAALIAGALGAVSSSAHAGTLYGYDGGNTDLIYRIDTETLATAVIHDPGTALVGEVEYRDGIIYAAVRQDNTIRIIDADTGALLDTSIIVGAVTDRILAMEWVGDVLYGIVSMPGPGGGNPSSLVTINLASGQVNYIGATGRGAINGLTWKASEGRMYAINSVNSDTELLSINLASGAASSFGFITDDIGNRQRLSGLEFGLDGRLYTSPQFLTPNDSHLYVIHPDTLGFTDLGDTGRDFITLTAAPAPCPPRMFAYNGRGATLYSVDLDTVSATPVGLDPNSDILSETELAGGVIYGSDTGSNTNLHALNPATGQVIHTVTMTFPTGGNVITAMEWVNGALYAGFTSEGGGGGPTTLVTINPVSGAVTSVGATGVGSALGGIAHNPCTGATYAVSAGGSTGQLFRLNLNTGVATLVGDVTVNGAGVNLTALEFGPDGVLYALPNVNHALAGHLLRINPHNGNAADLGDLGNADLNSLTADLPPCDCSGADVNGDGEVNFTDLNDLLDAWGDTCGQMYSHTSADDSLYTVDINTAASAFVGADSPINVGSDNPAEMEYADGVIYVSRIWFRALDPTNGQILTELQLTPTAFGNAVTAMEDVDGTLYGAMSFTSGNTSHLVTINPANGVVTPVGATGYGPLGGLAFDTCEQVMYGVTSAGETAELLTIDLTSGHAVSHGIIMVDGDSINLTALEFGSDGELYTMPPQNHPLWPNLIRIDRETLIGTIVGNTNLPLFASMLTANPDTTCEGADVNGDGTVNFTDLNTLLDEWGQSCHPFAR